jgi:hypothetical protein
LPTLHGERRRQCLDAISEELGTRGLVRALGTAPVDEGAAFDLRTSIFDRIDALADPRGADALAEWLRSAPHVYFETRAAQALGTLGDLRGLDALGKRMRLDPQRTYRASLEWEAPLRRSDEERIHTARIAAELALMRPDAVAQIRAATEEPIMAWNLARPTPHALGFRSLAAMGSRKGIERRRRWANPQLLLPRLGEQPPMKEEWILTRPALRYVGMQRDEESWPVLLQMLRRRPAGVDVTMDALLRGGVAILGMTLRAIGMGASDGLSEWGDHRAFSPLVAYVTDPLNNEQSRWSGCTALGWIAQRSDFPTLVAAMGALATPEDAFRRRCLLQALGQRSGVFESQGILPLFLAEQPHLVTKTDNGTLSSAPSPYFQIARALARSGLDAVTTGTLTRTLRDPVRKHAALLALLLGADATVTVRAMRDVQSHANEPPRELAQAYYDTFDVFSDADLESGMLARCHDNARALAREEIGQEKQTWALALFKRRFGQERFDSGPHSLSSMRLRFVLEHSARGTDALRSAQAIRLLGAFGARATLLSLTELPAPVAPLARTALDENRGSEPIPPWIEERE